MNRYRTKKPDVGVSLFPFLAVLICTMGALIVLLVLVVQMARVDAAEHPTLDDETGPTDPRRVEQENYDWRRDMLEQQRERMRGDLVNNRSELEHLEQHIRELEARWHRLGDEAEDLRRRLQGEAHKDEASREQLEELQRAIKAARKQLEEAHARAARQQLSYAIVPYDGPRGTHRRPIYIECTRDGVIFQPEGVQLETRDFRGPLGPGNPLDAGLRAIRTYYAQAGQRANGAPYPLLLVRPEGVENYAAARAAMRSWDDEFGYELIDAAMHVKFPDPDPALAKLLAKAVADARSRQEIMAAAMPGRFGAEGDVGFVTAPGRSGVIRRSSGEREAWQQRQGGFGRGGDARYIDGKAPGQVDGAAPPEKRQSIGGPDRAGHPQGVAGAKQGNGVDPLAKRRGPNWGLPRGAPDATGITRPIRVACLPDRLIVLPERGETRAPEVVLVEGSLLDEIDTLVAKVWDHVDRWGIAVAGGYWKPVLHVSVSPGAEQRFVELQTLLEGSGLMVKRTTR